MKIIDDPERPKKRKVSKKTKKSWRKHVDTTDVDAFLENSRLEERLGAPFSERLDSDLFVIDTKKDEKIAENLKNERRLRLKNKEPKCFNVLKPHTAVPDPISKRNRVRTPEERKHPILKLKERERKLKGILKFKEKDALRNRALANKKRLGRPKRGEFNADVWAETEESPLKMNTEWLSSDTIRHTLVPLGKKKKRLPTSLHKKPSIVSAVESPHPGTSYNPSYKDHQDLLRGVAEKEKEFMKQEAHLLRVTKNMFKKVTADEKHRNDLHEMSEGLPTTGEKSKTDNDDNDADPTVKSVNPPVKNNKKTLKQRRKQKEQKVLALDKIQKKTEKKKVADIYKLKLIQKQLKSKDIKETKLREKRLKLKELKSVEAKTLSKVKFEPSDPDFVLPSEISGNLRNPGTVGNLLKDRFKSLQQRNIVAPGKLVLQRSKAKVKKFIKPDHKINWEAEMKRIQHSNPKVLVK